jgi:hypothetical protein
MTRVILRMASTMATLLLSAVAVSANEGIPLSSNRSCLPPPDLPLARAASWLRAMNCQVADDADPIAPMRVQITSPSAPRSALKRSSVLAILKKSRKPLGR